MEPVALTRVESLESERRLEGDDCGLDLVQVEQGEPCRQLVILEAARGRPLGDVQHAGVEGWRLGALPRAPR